MTLENCDRMIERYTKEGDKELVNFWTARKAMKIAKSPKYAHLRKPVKEVKPSGKKSA